MKRLSLIALFTLGLIHQALAQAIPAYNIKASLDPTENKIHVVQKITYTHSQNFSTESIYLNDWNHAYSSTESPLAKRLVEEYNRRFYLSKKSKRGATFIENILIDGKVAPWQRLANQMDIIKLDLGKVIQRNELVNLQITYTLQLPDAKFTGYGITANESYFLENIFLSIALQNKKEWTPISHLDLEDIPHGFGDYNIAFTLPENMAIQANLSQYKSTTNAGETTHSYRSKDKKQLLFHLGKNLNYVAFNFDGKEIYSNLKSNALSKAGGRYSLKKINAFLKEQLGEYPHQSILLSQNKYEKRPFYGLTLIPGFLKPFPPQFEFEVKALNTYLYHYLNEILPLHPREDYWLLGGLHTYLMMQYVIENYPDKKLLDLVLRQPIARFFLKKYSFKDLRFEDTFIEYHEFVLRRNLQQAITTPKDELIKFNEQIGTPSQMGLLLNYAKEFKTLSMADFIAAIKAQKMDREALQTFFFAFFNSDNSSFLQNYTLTRKTIDLSFDQFNKKGDSIAFSVKEKNNFHPPFAIGLMKNNRLLKEVKYSGKQLNTPLILPTAGADYLVINPKAKLPEFNPRNNFKKLNRLGVKPLRFTFVKDIENPRFNQILYNPRTHFNAYDGISLGVRLNNKTIKRKPLTVTFEPFYAAKEKALVGSLSTAYSHFNSENDYYLKKFTLAGSSFHYNTNLRYSSVFASANVFKRNPNLRDNKKQLYNLFWQYVNREENENTLENPNYSILGFNYIYSNKGALDYFTLKIGTEGASKFGKINFTTEYRHLMRSGRQVSLRLFAGKFLWRNDISTNYFDYSLDRPTDYLFQYGYIGRSETSGIYSQQFIPAEGGFKAKFDRPFSDNFLLTLNTSIGVWKWIEAYADLGYINQRKQASRWLYDSGIRLNLVPDFLEIYFPLYNSNGLQLQDPNYEQKIRYVITLDPRTLTQLFSRRWF